jgi:hypothetical protein
MDLWKMSTYSDKIEKKKKTKSAYGRLLNLLKCAIISTNIIFDRISLALS